MRGTRAAHSRWPPGPAGSVVVGRCAFAVMSPGGVRRWWAFRHRLLRHRYTARHYELVEFAALTLLARARALVPLHAAAVVCEGQCVLLLGDSGAGKSTLCLCTRCMRDCRCSPRTVCSSPGTRASRPACRVFCSCPADATRWLQGAPRVPRVDGASFIRRRGGVRKLEIDLRRARLPLAASPVRLGAVVVLEGKSAGRTPLMRLLQRRALLAALDASQPYAASRPEWPDFRKAITRIPAFAMRRASEPRAAVDALRAALAGDPT